MHLSDFKALQASKAWKHFLYLSENQPGYYCGEPVKVNLAFCKMLVGINPNVIFLKSDGSWFRLDFVTAVDCESHMLGDLLKVTCKGGEQYIIVAQ